MQASKQTKTLKSFPLQIQFNQYAANQVKIPSVIEKGNKINRKIQNLSWNPCETCQ
jgi:hypothetical protein